MHGTFKFDIIKHGDGFIINNQKIQSLSENNISCLPWRKLKIDIVVDCSGKVKNFNQANYHLNAGAKKVLVSSPIDEDVVKTVVFGINDQHILSSDNIISNASCTTNCLAFLLEPLDKAFVIQSGFFNTIHAYTNDQNLIDGNHKDLRRARSATNSIIPAETGASKSIFKVLPNLNGKIKGVSSRVPVSNVSFLDLIIKTEKSTTKDEVNDILQKYAESIRRNRLVHVNKIPLVSIDFNHASFSSIFDLTQTKVMSNLIKVSAWYDNEWGYSSRMIDVIKKMV